MPFLRLFFSNTHYVYDVISCKSLAFILLITSHGSFVQFPPRLKKKWCFHHTLQFFCFFVSLLWNYFMASWACSTYDSFTQGVSIGWYPFHLIKYSCSCPFNCLDLSIASISNSGSLLMKLGGGFELYFWLSLEASWVTGLKNKT